VTVERALIPVTGMHCGGCERSVREAVERLAGVECAVAEHIGDEVEVVYDPALVGPAEIRAAIAAVGFTPGG
jgi:copper chaperone